MALLAVVSLFPDETVTGPDEAAWRFRLMKVAAAGSVNAALC